MEDLVRKPAPKEMSDLITVEDFQKLWMEVTVPDLKPSTQGDYKSIVRKHISKAPFYKQPVDRVTRGQIKRYLKSKSAKGLSVSTVTHIKNALGKIFTEAVDDEIIQHNPVHGIKIGSRKENGSRKPKIIPLEVAEVNTLLATFKKKKPEFYPLVLLLVNTGCRIGEAVALQWQDVDLDGREILIQRNFVRNKIEDSTKNGKDRRVDITTRLADCLRELKAEKAAEALAAEGKWIINQDWLFPSVIDKSKKPLNYDRWRSGIFYPMLDQAKLRRIRIHDLRHTFASIMISAGCDLVYLRDQLGHSSIKVTADVYGHLLKGNKDKPVDILDTLLEVAN